MGRASTPDEPGPGVHLYDHQPVGGSAYRDEGLARGGAGGEAEMVYPGKNFQANAKLKKLFGGGAEIQLPKIAGSQGWVVILDDDPAPNLGPRGLRPLERRPYR